MATKENTSKSFSKVAAVLGLFAIVFLTGFAAANLGQKNEAAEEFVEAAPPAVTTTTATTTQTATTEPATVAPAVDSFSYNVVDETIVVGGVESPVEIVNKTFLGDEYPVTLTAKAVVNGKTVLLNGKVPATVLEPIVCKFKFKEGYQSTKLPDGCFVSATIE